MMYNFVLIFKGIYKIIILNLQANLHTIFIKNINIISQNSFFLQKYFAD